LIYHLYQKIFTKLKKIFIVNDGELENLTSSHVKEALEHAYPNSVTEEDLAESLRCSVEEIRHFLSILEKEGHIEQLPNQIGEWIRKAYSLSIF